MTDFASIQVDQLYPDTPSLRIALVTETYPPDINGVANTIHKVVEGLRKRGHEVMLVRPRQQGDAMSADQFAMDELLVRGAAIPMYKQLKMGLPAQGALKKLWTNRRPDIVHIATEGPLGWSASRIARKLKIPTSSDFRTNFHAYSQFYGFGWLKGAIVAYLRKFHNATHCTMVPSAPLLSELSRVGFERLLIVPRGVDTTHFTPEKRSDELRRQWGADTNTQILLSVGRLASEKNLDTVVRAYQAMKSRNLSVKLVFVGDGPLRSHLEAICPSAIFSGMRTGHDLAAHYASADLFVFPSMTETFGNVTIEAMASGLAVIAYDHAAAGQLILHEQNGMLIAPHEEQELFSAIGKLIENKTLRESIRSNSRQTSIEHDWNSVIARTEGIFRSLIKDQSTCSRTNLIHQTI
ncbi:glycosyltransferase family 1 protein [Orrella sp. NBD-18]|uniref:Glycosyltransferase family 1 protein n=1 Tax=Sheuella amnicola TaxID=2707330 RepID=A0A6B2R108_9BURK|nr:glycosyltransferase family 1 protein [Sheuella amnicola]NDY82677.1 glycosyltransferase family 1 protein [Sheuella amnicola]HBI83114.1 glycoside hydrolase [Alcaligenaceae bacterium]